MRLLVWLALGLLVYFALRIRAKRNWDNRNQDARNQEKASRANFGAQSDAEAGGFAQPTPNSSRPTEKMVACAYCQIYLPSSEATHLASSLASSSATSSSDLYFCSEEHAKLYSDAVKNSPQQPDK